MGVIASSPFTLTREGWPLFLVGGVYGLEGVDDSVQICRALCFVGGTEDVEKFVAAVEAVERPLGGFAGFVFEAFQVRKGDLFQRAADYRVTSIFVGVGFVPEIGEGGFAVGQAVNHAQTEDGPFLQADGVEMDVGIALVVLRNRLRRKGDAESVVGIDVGFPLLFGLEGRRRGGQDYEEYCREKGFHRFFGYFNSRHSLEA